MFSFIIEASVIESNGQAAMSWTHWKFLVYTHFPGNLQVDLINLININQLFSSEGVILNFRLEGLWLILNLQ